MKRAAVYQHENSPPLVLHDMASVLTSLNYSLLQLGENNADNVSYQSVLGATNDLQSLLKLAYAQQFSEHYPFQTLPLINRTYLLLQPTTAKQSITLHCNCRGATLSGYPFAFYRMLVNLVTNSISAVNQSTRSQKSILISDEHDGDHYILRVKDNGCGMEESKVEMIKKTSPDDHIFKNPHGNGLVLVKSVLIRHQADWDIASKSGEGTTFIMKFPTPGPTYNQNHILS